MCIRDRDSINTIQDGFAVFDSGLKLVAANRAYLAPFKDKSVAPGLCYVDILRIAAERGLIDMGEVTAADWVAMMQARWDQDPIDPMTVRFHNGTWVRLVDQRARDGDMVSLVLNITEQMRIWACLLYTSRCV